MLVAAAIALFAIMRSCNGEGSVVDNVKDATENVVDKAGDAAAGAADAIGDAAEGATDMVKDAAGAAMDAAAQAGSVLAGLGQKALDAAKSLGKTVTDGIASFTLPGGQKISTPEGSNAEAFLTFLAAEGDDLNTRFTLDRVNFETGSANITAESQEQINNFAAILDAYKSVHIRLEGHTDNTGDAEANKNLSTQRALAVKNALAQLGTGSDRMESAGFGQEQPVADNATPEGRAINRRVDVYVTKK